METLEVINYYKNCDIDYRWLWKTNRNFSMHYGFFDNEHKTHNSAVINMNRFLAKLSGIKSSDKIFDAGCGVGGSLVWFAKKKWMLRRWN